MVFKFRDVDGVSVLDLNGEIDLYRSPDVRESLAKVIAAKKIAVVLNFSGVAYIDSSGLATVIDAFQKMRVYGGKLFLVGMAKSVRSVFEVARLDQFFQIFDDEPSAVAAIKGA